MPVSVTDNFEGLGIVVMFPAASCAGAAQAVPVVVVIVPVSLALL